MAKNNNLHSAKRSKMDEFYTQFEDIQKEMFYYKDYFKGKVVLCNCDDAMTSNFTKYFILKFRSFGLKKLICTYCDINNEKFGYAFVYNGEDMNNDDIINNDDIEIITKNKYNHNPLISDKGFDIENKEECWKKGIYGAGDFRSKNCIEYLKQADIVVTNPPFSLFREYVKQLMDYDKKFIIIGNTNAATYKDIFPYIKNNQLWVGVTNYNVGMYFELPDDYEDYKYINSNGKKVGRVSTSCWWTNIVNKRRTDKIELWREYNPTDYPKYDNYDAIDVSKYEDIPMDYDGVMGVPITFLGHYNPTQFEIIALGNSRDNFTPNKDYIKPLKVLKDGKKVNGNAINCVLAIESKTKPINTIYYTSENVPYLVAPYARILIKRVS